MTDEIARASKPEIDVQMQFRNRPPSPARGPFTVAPSGFGRNFFEHGINTRAEPFRGVRGNQPVDPSLFTIEPTGVSTEPVLLAAKSFLKSLTSDQRASCLFGVESDAWRSWHNLHTFVFRHGLCLADMTEQQRSLALDLMRQSLSERGFETARNVMRLNEHMGELRGRPDDYGEWFYWISIMGHPSATEPWGWQIDGHHLIVNCFVLGEQLVLTPTFMGSEPVVAKSGAHAGTQVLADEERLGWSVMHSLTQTQQTMARIGEQLPFDVFAHAFNDNLELEYEGICANTLSSTQRQHLVELLTFFVERDRPGHAEHHLRQVLGYLDQTYFAWIGACDDVSPFYYRVHSPTILIEFDHQPGVVFANDEFTRLHAHTMVRTPNGNDYGKALLRQYYDRARRLPLHAESERTPRQFQPLGDAIEDLNRGNQS